MIIKIGYRKIRAIWKCDLCGKNFERTNRRANESIKKGHKSFCSKECIILYNRDFSSKRVVEYVKKNGHPRFKDGRGITTDGYIWIHIENEGYYHNQVKEHRWIMQNHIGRKLLPTEIVHHIDGNKFNNKLDNLQIVTRSEHNKIHKFLW